MRRVLALHLLLSACRSGAPETAGVRRVVTLTPSHTEIAFALGRGDRVVGVSDWCAYPPDATKKPRVGGLVDPNLERILALRPDLVVLDSDPVGLGTRLRDAGVRTLVLRSESLADLDRAIDRLGEALGARGAAGRLRRSVARDLEAVKSRVRGLPRPKVLVVADRRPGHVVDVYAVGKKSFLSELIETAGGTNVLADVDHGAVALSTESLLAEAPDVIFDATRDPAGTSPWRALGTIPAVRTGRIHDFSDPAFTIPGPRVGRAAERLARQLHPEAFR
jgi:iron complex transport system substrate-binding protein